MLNEPIRAAYKAAIETVYTAGRVYSGRVLDVRDVTEYVSVYMASGQFHRPLSGDLAALGTECELFISIAKSNATDAQLDAIATNIMAAIAAAPECCQPMPMSFEYGQTEDNINTLTLTYQVLF